MPRVPTVFFVSVLTILGLNPIKSFLKKKKNIVNFFLSFKHILFVGTICTKSKESENTLVSSSQFCGEVRLPSWYVE